MQDLTPLLAVEQVPFEPSLKTRLEERLVGGPAPPQDQRDGAEPLIYREEVIAMLLTLADIKFGINRIIWLLENGDDGEEEAQGNDS